jgi:membrane protease YdiL (CAAX protease family)
VSDLPIPLAAESLPPPPSPQKARLSRIFVGPDGLRAGWGLAIFFTLFGIFTGCVVLFAKATHSLLPSGANTEVPLITGVVEALSFVAVFLAAWIMSKIEKRPNSEYGLGATRAVPNFFLGLFWGLVCLSLLIMVLRVNGLLVFDGRILFGGGIFRYGFLWFLGFLTVGLLEEYLTRGYLLFTLARGLGGIYAWIFKTPHSKALGFWTAAVALSALFGFSHHSNPGESPVGLLSAGIAGLVWCYGLWRTGTLWWGIGFHATWDWSQSFLYGVADSGLMVEHHMMASHPVGSATLSGGTTGPEGSIYILPFLLLMVLLIRFTVPRTPHPMAE